MPAAADEGAAHQYSPLCEAWGRRLLQPAQPRVRADGAAVADRDGSSAAQQGAAGRGVAIRRDHRGQRYKCIYR